MNYGLFEVSWSLSGSSTFVNVQCKMSFIVISFFFWWIMSPFSVWFIVFLWGITSCYTIYTLWNSDMAMTTRVYYFMLHHLHCVKLWHGYDYSCILPHATPSTLCGSLIHHVYNNKPCWMFRLNERKPYTACPMLYIHQRVLWFI